VAVDARVGHLGASGSDDQERNGEFALLHQHLTRRRDQRAQLRGQRDEVLGGAARKDFQRGQFVCTNICQARHLTRLRRAPRDEQL